MGPVSAPAAPVVFVPVFVPVEVPTDVIQSVVQEEAAEAVVQEATALTITSAQSVAVAENTVTAFHTVIASPISGGGTSFSLPSGESNNDLFTINASTGELTFVTHQTSRLPLILMCVLLLLTARHPRVKVWRFQSQI